MSKKNAPKNLVCPVLMASQIDGAISVRRNAANNAYTLAIQMLVGDPEGKSFEKTDTIEESTPSGKKVRTKVGTGKTVEWRECGVLFLDDTIEIDGALYRITVGKRKAPSGALRDAIVVKPVTSRSDSTVATEGAVF